MFPQYLIVESRRRSRSGFPSYTCGGLNRIWAGQREPVAGEHCWLHLLAPTPAGCCSWLWRPVCRELCKWRGANHVGSVSFRFANWLCVSFMLSLREVLLRKNCLSFGFCLLVFPDMASTPRPTLCPPAPHSASPYHHLPHLDGLLPGRRDVHPLISQLHLYTYNFLGHPCLCLTNSAPPTTQAQVKKSSHQVFKV